MTKTDKLTALEFFLKNDDLMSELFKEMNYLLRDDEIIIINGKSFNSVFINRFAAFCELYRINYVINNNQIQTL